MEMVVAVADVGVDVDVVVAAADFESAADGAA